MNIGIISDIHGPLPEVVREIFEHCGAILCAGDTCNEDTYLELQSIAPTTMVYGNCDRDVDYGSRVTDKATPSFDGCRFAMVHKAEDLGELPRKCKCVITGHTHVSSLETINGVLWLNPGSPTNPREGSKASVAMVEVEEREVIRSAIVDLDDPYTALQDFGSDSLYGGFEGIGRGDGSSRFGSSTSGSNMGIDFSELC